MTVTRKRRVTPLPERFPMMTYTGNDSFAKCAFRHVQHCTCDVWHGTDTASQIFAGSALGFLISAVIGAAFLAIWFTKASDLWKKSEELWEGQLFVTPIVIYYFFN
jgi:hypothetical protein